MGTKSPSEVVSLLRSNAFRLRTALWLMPSVLLGQERNAAARLMVDAIDLRDVLLQHLPEGSRFSRLSDQKITELLDEVSELEGQSDCALVYNLDLLLARLSPQGVKAVWQYVFEFMPHRSRALLLAMPASAIELLPSEEQKETLIRQNRIVNMA